VVHEIGSTVAESARALHSAVWQASFYAATVRHILPRHGFSLSERPRNDDGRLVFVRQAYGSHARFWVDPELVERFEHESDARRAIDEEAGPLLRELGCEP
jgi:hypothetical protein